MKRIAALFLLAACLFAGEASAVWVRMSDADLVGQSDIIVSATLVRIERQAMSGSASSREIGVLDIHDILKGPANIGVVHLALPSGDAPRSSSDIHYSIGQKGLWFLRTVPPEGERPLYRADHPQRFLRDKEAIPRMPYFQDLIESRR
ncbi:hypothetical protein [Massilia niastensis]|uniref:hypothetical protein n=1 Tax=Massilia niastensis TaxID=544911 RepID=UPI0003633F69|nr:hypothetical protein [Massilia niastensis]